MVWRNETNNENWAIDNKPFESPRERIIID